MKKLRVCITLEGSYPYITGGVSAWVHDLIQGLPYIDFVLFTISPAKEQPLRYSLPENVVEHRDLVLSQYQKSRVRMSSRKKKEIMKIIGRAHKDIQNPDLFHNIVRNIPEGYYLYRDGVLLDEGWGLITRANQEKNPVYPFSDYFWAWKSAHDLVFSIVGSSLPDADIYHSVSTGFAGLAALTAKIRKQRPFLLSEHGLYHKEREIEIRKAGFLKGYQRDMWIKMYNSLSRICYSSADTITALFEENRQKQIELGADADKVIVTPNGIDIKRFDVERKPRKGFHVGLVGRVVPIKDIKTYITTAMIVLKKIPDALFYCIGPVDEDPGYYEECKRLVESLKISENFIFTGRVNVLEYYCFLDVLVLTSIREAQPLVLLEAWMGGVATVATRVGNIPEMLDFDTRFLAASKDSVQLAEGIFYIYSHEDEMKGIRERNREKVLSYYDKEKLHEIYGDLYSNLREGLWQV